MNRQQAGAGPAYQWQPQPQAAQLAAQLISTFVDECKAAANLAARMRDETGTRFSDWIDHVAAPAGRELEDRLAKVGFEPHADQDRCVWRHPLALLPTIITASGQSRCIAIRVESVDDFLATHRIHAQSSVQGAPLGPLRRALVARDADIEFWIVERHGYAGFDLVDISSAEAQAIRHNADAFRHRRRDQDDPDNGFDHALKLIRSAAAELNADRAADLFFAAEREYWQGRNRAARIQKARQDALGLGWANHDHHTYRSGRRHFARLIQALEELGCRCRERFYAGHQAGWGAQVLEQSACRIVIFADVDLAPHEVAGDFAHEPLPARAELGTVGLWCFLHGESFLQAGMHHLECQFDFELVRVQLTRAGVPVMSPFTDLPYLKQAFSEAEIWPVAPDRIEAAQSQGLITAQQADQFRRLGAPGSHLEMLERDDGYKGFNQTGISDIIRRTDPRSYSA